MKLITETVFDNLGICEAVDSRGQKQLYIEGIFAQAELQNRNGRVYPSRILEREMNRFIEEKVNTGRALGELEHPETPMIQLERASHRITEMKREGNNYIGKAVILSTPCGQIARGLIEGGTAIGVSTRGMGSWSKRSGVQVINDDFNLVTVDIVGDPSGIHCFVNGIMEGVEWVMDSKGVYAPKKRDEVFKKVKTVISETRKLSAISKFLDSL